MMQIRIENISDLQFYSIVPKLREHIEEKNRKKHPKGLHLQVKIDSLGFQRIHMFYILHNVHVQRVGFIIA